MKATWPYTCGGGGRGKFMGKKQRLSDRKQLKTFIASAVAKALKIKRKSKAKAKQDYD